MDASTQTIAGGPRETGRWNPRNRANLSPQSNQGVDTARQPRLRNASKHYRRFCRHDWNCQVAKQATGALPSGRKGRHLKLWARQGVRHERGGRYKTSRGDSWAPYKRLATGCSWIKEHFYMRRHRTMIEGNISARVHLYDDRIEAFLWRQTPSS